MNTTERLESYGQFDQEVIDTVAEVADRHSNLTDHHELFGFLNMDLIREHSMGYSNPVDTIDIRPREHDPKAALMIHLAMGQPLDPNNIFQIAVIAEANPNTRILASGNPTGPGYFSPEFNRSERKTMAKGNFGPINEPLMRIAENEGIEQLDQYGYSFGADTAMEAAATDMFETPRVIVVEPVTVVKRSLLGLGLAFAKSGSALNGYVEQSGPLFEKAREESLGMVGFNLGLSRLSNLAISRGLSQGGFKSRTARALTAQPDMHATIAWGTESELSLHEATNELVIDLQGYYGKDRVSGIRLDDQKHALANDVYLQAALVTQGLKAK